MKLEKEFRTYIASPVGLIEIISNELAVKRINFLKNKKKPVRNDIKNSKVLRSAVKQIEQYFKGKRKFFDLPLFIKGTPMQQSVWMEILNIPRGETSSYKDISVKIKKPNAYRTVGSAVGKNPLPLIIPCHRVIHSNGDIKGFTGGNNIKKILLKHEGVIK
jgi:methylated-DNA-[protein]-cysteine S-methyltransferase